MTMSTPAACCANAACHRCPGHRVAMPIRHAVSAPPTISTASKVPHHHPCVNAAAAFATAHSHNTALTPSLNH
jgi:hypothetical protein